MKMATASMLLAYRARSAGLLLAFVGPQRPRGRERVAENQEIAAQSSLSEGDIRQQRDRHRYDQEHRGECDHVQ